MFCAPLSVGRFAAFFTVKLQAEGRMMEQKGSAGLGLVLSLIFDASCSEEGSSGTAGNPTQVPGEHTFFVMLLISVLLFWGTV